MLGLQSLGLKPEIISSIVIASGLKGFDTIAAQALPLIMGDGSNQDAASDMRRIRDSGFENPLIYLIAERDPETVAGILDAGADDVIGPPYSPRVVAARLRAATRKKNGVRKSTFKIGDVNIFMDGRHPEVNGEQIKLSTTESEILRVLVLNRGHATPRRALFDALYTLSDYTPHERSIDVHISRLRKKLSSATSGGSYIETFSGRGYMLATGE